MGLCLQNPEVSFAMAFPQWDDLQHGDSLDTLVRILVIEEHRLLCCTVENPSRAIVIKGRISLQVSSDKAVVLNAKVIEVKPMLVCEIGEQSSLHSLPLCQVHHLRQVVELCSGLGAWSSIAPQLGFSVIAGNDENPRWEELFGKLHDGTPFLSGDCSHAATIARLLALDGANSIYLAGVNCQPHSSGGDQLGFADPRAMSLPKVLKTTWIMQASIVLMECVPSVMTNRTFQQHLKSFCKATGMTLRQQILQLSDAWCAKRDRWFGVLTNVVVGPIEIPSLPSFPQFANIRSVMPYIRDWDPEDFEQLKLGLYELTSFEAYAVGGIRKAHIELDQHLPTSLHSISNQLYPCSCGCRPGFSLQRLQRDGLYGVLIPLESQVFHESQFHQECRYPHPNEIFLMNGGDPKVNFSPHMRLALAGIGQCVSPIQGLWVLSQVHHALCKLQNSSVVDPRQTLEQYVQQVLVSRDQLWR